MSNIFNIYHAVGPDRFTESPDQIRLYVGHIQATSVEEAYRLSQNTEQPWNMNQPCRSTSVGDCIETNNRFFMVCNTGFQELIYEEDSCISEETMPVLYEADLYDYSAE